MGSFFIDLLSFDHEVAVFEKDARRMRFTYNCQRFTDMEEIRAFKPELVINAVTLKYTIPVFEQVLPFLPQDCIVSDIASVKTDLKEYYEKTGIQIGFKPAGGLNTVHDALVYYTIVKEVLGEQWLTNQWLRLGTSRLANLLLSEVVGEETKFF